MTEWFRFIEIQSRKSTLKMKEPHHQMRTGCQPTHFWWNGSLI